MIRIVGNECEIAMLKKLFEKGLVDKAADYDIVYANGRACDEMSKIHICGIETKFEIAPLCDKSL